MRRDGGGLRGEEGAGKNSCFHLLLRLALNAGTEVPEGQHAFAGRVRDGELRDYAPFITSSADSVPWVQDTLMYQGESSQL